MHSLHMEKKNEFCFFQKNSQYWITLIDGFPLFIERDSYKWETFLMLRYTWREEVIFAES